MDGVFDLFHLGHLQAIQQCAKLGNRVVIGVTGDADAADYKLPPIVPELECRAIIAALQDVDEVVCPCPLIVTEEFMKTHHIDLVAHGFSNEADAQRQEKFFAIPAHQGKFQTIPYYRELSTTDRIRNICESFGREEDETSGKDPTTNILSIQERRVVSSHNGLDLPWPGRRTMHRPFHTTRFH
jgi:cytidyltransferase-like protein